MEKEGKKEKVETLHSHEMSISHAHTHTYWTSCLLCAELHFEEEKLVCPAKLEKEILTVVAYDNINRNTSNTSNVPSMALEHPYFKN